MAVSKLCEAVKVFLDVVDSPYGYLEGCLGLGLSNDTFELVTRRIQTKICALGWCPQNHYNPEKMHQFVKQNMHTFSCFQRFWSDFFRFCALKFYLCVADPWYKYLKCSSGQVLSRDINNMGIRCTQTKICALIEKTHVESRIGFQFSKWDIDTYVFSWLCASQYIFVPLFQKGW